MTLDIEGAEFKVLKTVPWKKVWIEKRYFHVFFVDFPIFFMNVFDVINASFLLSLCIIYFQNAYVSLVSITDIFLG